MTIDADIRSRLGAVLSRLSPGEIRGLTRLSGGANMESWSIDWGVDGAIDGYVLRRAPSDAWTATRPFDLESEAALVRAMHDAGVRAPEVVHVLTPVDGLGAGYVMRRVEAEVTPAAILASAPEHLIDDIAGEMAKIHAVPLAALPAGIPPMDTADALAALRQRFVDYGGDRPIIALALHWLADHLPVTAAPVLVHGDLRLGNIMATAGGLAAILDWELAHIGDAHEDLAYGCMTVWRFGAIDRPAFGLASLDRYCAAYEAAGGGPVDRDRFHFWLVYRTCWWALGCLQMGAIWREGIDAGLERVVIARRTAEQELDLLLLLERDAPEVERARSMPPPAMVRPPAQGEPTTAEMIGAVRDWLASDVKPGAQGRDRFMTAVAMNALGIAQRDLLTPAAFSDCALATALLAGTRTLAEPGLLACLRRQCLDKIANDSPKYPAIALASARWNAAAQNGA